ncbi:MAG TPA: sigma-70 family RNA polymerase sigma factor [Bacteroidota bacterium]|nr:sigma-70 family RNA polymerase sigma factor [Bacteroidota bacterium]
MAELLPFAGRDAALIDRIRKGEEDALLELYRDQRRAVESLVVRGGGRREDADDVLQEALVALWENVRTGRFSLSARLGTYIYATAKHIWFRRRARGRREIAGEAVDPPDGGESPLEEAISEEEASIVRRALDELGEPCRTILLMFYWEEEPMESIAARLGMANADTVKSRKYQCKKALGELVKKRMSGND